MNDTARDGEFGKTSFSAGRMIRGLLFCGVAAFIFSFPYVFILNKIAIVFLVDILAVFAMGYVMGAVAKAAMRRLKINSTLSAVIMGLGAGVLGVWFAWLAYVFLWFDYNVEVYIVCASNPLNLLGFITLFAHNPVWSLDKEAWGPLFYYAVWSAELIVVVAVAMKSSRAFVEENAKCESCGEWIAQTGDNAQFSLSGKPEVTERLAAGDVSALAELPLYDPATGEPAWVEAKGYACPNCRDRESMVSASVVHLAMNNSSSTPQRVERPIFRFRPVSVEMEEKIFEAARSDSAADASPGTVELDEGVPQTVAEGESTSRD